MLWWDLAIGPCRFVGECSGPDQGQLHAVWVVEGEHRFAERSCGCLVLHTLIDQSVRPVGDRRLGNAEAGGEGEPHTTSPGSCVLPWKEGQDRPRCAGLITVVEMIRAGIVEVDRLFHEPEAKHARVEREVVGRLTGYGGDVMNAVH